LAFVQSLRGKKTPSTTKNRSGGKEEERARDEYSKEKSMKTEAIQAIFMKSHKMIKGEVEDLERGLIIVLSQTLFLSPQRHAQS
jgi:hypothetical protein